MGTPTNQTGEAAGTGIVLSSNGLVLTNNHVISGSTSIKATDVGNRKSYTAQVVGYDRTHDVALIQLKNASGLQTAKLGNSTGVSIGDTVVGLGNAGGLGGSPSVAAGQVTGLNQSITAQDESTGASEQLSGLIQIDADIQPGDSGGALVNSSAEVVGVDTAASAGFSFQTQAGQGFAIPINQAVSIAHEIQSGHNTSTVHIGSTAFLGVYLNEPTSSNGGSGATGGSSGSTAPGASVVSVIAGGPAAAAGLTGGDVITSINSAAVASADSLTKIISLYHPGDKITVGWTDSSGTAHHAALTLTDGPAQ